MNEKEMIEEMAKDLGIAFQLAGSTSFIKVAEILVGKYRKIPEDSVVLSKNEYEELNITGKYFNDALKQARKETAKEIFIKGKDFYKTSYHKNNAMNRLADWIQERYGVNDEQ